MNTDVLMVTQCAPYTVTGNGFAGVHGCLPQAVGAVRQFAQHHRMTFQVSDDVDTVGEGDLSMAKVLVLFTIGDTPWSTIQRKRIAGRIEGGGLQLLAIHAASDASHDWPEYGQLVGGRFAGHPVSADLPMTVVDPAHPSTQHLPATWTLHDELYLFDQVREDAHVLLRVEDAEAARLAPGTARPAAGYPLAWCHRYGKGRCFTTALGHYPAAWEDVAFVRHVGGGFAWLMEGVRLWERD